MPSKTIPRAGTPQFRTLLIRKLKNMYPGRRIEIADLPNGIAFQLFDAHGAEFGRPTSIFAYQRMSLTRTALLRLIGAP